MIIKTQRRPTPTTVPMLFFNEAKDKNMITCLNFRKVYKVSSLIEDLIFFLIQKRIDFEVGLTLLVL